MKHIIKIALLMTLALVVLSACQENNNPLQPATAEVVNDDSYHTVSQRMVDNENDTYVPIRDSRDSVVGYIFLSNKNLELYVTYYLLDGWKMTHNYLHVARDYSDIPMNDRGAPLPEQFNNNNTLTRGVSVFSVKVNLAVQDVRVGDEIVIASLARVARYDASDRMPVSEDIWVGDQAGRGTQWWNVTNYKVRANIFVPGEQVKADLPPNPDHIRVD